MYSCRWRTEEDHLIVSNETKLKEKIWWSLLILIFLLGIILMYCWSVFENDYNDFEWFIYDETGKWFSWGLLILIFIVIAAFYLTVLVTSGIILIAKKNSRNLHLCNKILICFLSAVFIAGYILIQQLWNEEYYTAILALQIMAPFFHIVVLTAVTLASWLIYEEVMQIEKKTLWVVVNLIVIIFLLFLYLIPIAFRSPCIGHQITSKKKPLLIGHRGSSRFAPENTIMSFEKATSTCDIFAVETDISISLDGIPFLMHDATLTRTTDVATVFPEKVNQRAEWFSWNELQQLNSGSWYLKQDPYHTVRFMSDAEKQEAKSQKIPSLHQLVRLVHEKNVSLIFDLRSPPYGHPFYNEHVNLTMEVVINSGLEQHSVLWLPDFDRSYVEKRAPGFRQVSHPKPIPYLHELNIEIANLQYNLQTYDDIKAHLSSNISVIEYVVSSPWLFSLSWCQGATFVTTEECQKISKINSPAWTLTPEEYLAIWISCDILSLAIYVIIFFVQSRKYACSFVPWNKRFNRFSVENENVTLNITSSIELEL